MHSNTHAQCTKCFFLYGNPRSEMAGASDPLEEMLFSEVDEKAVSDLVGSLESQLADSQADTEGHTRLENRGNGSTATTNHHLGKTLPARVGTTTLEQQQQGGGGRHKAGVHPGTHCKGISSEKPVRASPPSSPPPLDEASVTSDADQKENASSGGGGGSPSRETSITTSTASALSTLAPSRLSISTAAPGPMVTAVSSSGGARPTNPPRKRAAVASKRSASARLRSLTGGAVSTRRSSCGASASDLGSPAAGCTSAAATSRAGTASCSRTTTTLALSNASSVQPAAAAAAGQSCGALDRGTPTIALHRLPNHIVASIALNGNGTTVSALVQQGARLGPITCPGAQLNHNAAVTLNTSVSKSDESHHKTAMASQSCNTNSVISTCSSSVVLTTAAATFSSPTTAAGCATGVVTTARGSGQTTAPNMHTNTVRLAAPSAAPVGAAPAAQCQPRPGLTAPPQRIVAPQQLIVRAPQPPTTIQLPPGFTIPQGKVFHAGDWRARG